MTASGRSCDETLRVPKTGVGVLGRRQRRWAWIGFVAMASYAPLVAYALNAPLVEYGMPADTWMLSITVAGLIAFVLIVDDIERRKAPTEGGDSASSSE
jgi:hypothetical protein